MSDHKSVEEEVKAEVKAEVAVQSIKPGERNELRRIIKGRVALLREQTAVREMEVANRIRERIKKEAEATQNEAQARLEDFLERYNGMVDEAAELQASIEGGGMVEVNAKLAYYLNKFSGRDIKVVPKDLNNRVANELRKLKEEGGLARVNLKALELELLEELTVGALETEAAQDFMGRIPTIDKLLPMPSSAQLDAAAANILTSGGDED